jgi:hypothetical protein
MEDNNMKVDQLPMKQQESASYCHACGEVKPKIELGACLVCGYRLCLTSDCRGLCLCDDARKGKGKRCVAKADMKKLSLNKLFRVERDPKRYRLLSRVSPNYEQGFSN